MAVPEKSSTVAVKGLDNRLDLSTIAKKTAKEQREADWSILRKLSGHIWPKGDKSTRTRVVLAVALLVGGKVSWQ